LSGYLFYYSLVLALITGFSIGCWYKDMKKINKDYKEAVEKTE